MKRPSHATMIVGHPVIAGVATLGGLALIYGAWQSSNIVVGILALFAVGKVSHAFEAAQTYKRWQRAWDAMDDDAARRQHDRRVKIRVMIATFAVMALLTIAYASGEAVWRGIGAMLLLAFGFFAIVLLIWTFARWLWRPRRARPKSAPTVTVIAKPLLSVPSLEDAYRALPAHCWRVL